MKTRLLAVVAVSALSLIGIGAPAYAHDQLVTTTPENGQVLATAPADITLTFTEGVLDIGTAIVVMDSSGTDWAASVPTVQDGTLTTALKSGMPNGVYTVNWRVVSADGHPVGASFVFGIGSSAAIADEVATAAAAVSAPIEDEASTTDGELVTATADPAATDTTGNTLMIATVGGLVAIVLFAGGILAIRRGRARVQHDSDEADA